MSTHYVAQLKIERVDKTSPPERTTQRVTMLTIKADTLESLVLKLGKHIEIIEEA